MKRVLTTVASVLMCLLMPVMVAAAAPAVVVTPLDKEHTVTIVTNGKTADGLLVLTYDEEELSIEEDDVVPCEGIEVMYSVNVDEKGIVKISYLTEKTIPSGAFMTLDFEKLESVEEVKSVVKITEGKVFDQKGNELPVIVQDEGGSGSGDVEDTPETETENKTPVKPNQSTSADSKKDETVNSEAEEDTKKEAVEVLIPVGGTLEEKTEAIVEAIEEVKEGNDVVVKLIDAESGNAEISIEVLTKLQENKGKDVNLVIELASGFTWTIDADSIDVSAVEGGLSAIDFWVDVVEEVVPSELVSEIAAESQTTFEISLKHNGAFGLTAALGIPVGNEFAGRMATLYYYNAEANTMEEQGKAEIDENGIVTYLFQHASDYVIVIEEAAEEVVTPETPADTENIEATEAAGDAGVNAGGSNNMVLIGIILIIVVIAAAVVIYMKKMNK